MFFIIKKNIIVLPDPQCWQTSLQYTGGQYWSDQCLPPCDCPPRWCWLGSADFHDSTDQLCLPLLQFSILKIKEIISENYQKIKAVCHQPLRKLEKWSHHFELEVGGTFQKVRPDSGCTDLKVIVKDERIVHNHNMYHLSCFREWFI